MREKNTFKIILLVFTISLLILPLLVSFNEVLTSIVERNKFYNWVEKRIVPIEARMMGVILLPFGYQYAFSPSNSIIVVNDNNIKITWNCLGWQGMLLFIVTLLFGFSSKYTKLSIIESVVIGILGTFWLNILRMIFTVILAVYLPAVFRIVFHDYLAAITTIIWLFFFWWFAYSYVLEEKESP